MSRMYIIGAGASYGYGFPLMNTLTADLCNFLKGDDRATLTDAIYEAFGWRSGSSDAAPNFEDVLNSFDSRALLYLDGQIQSDTSPRLQAAKIALRGLRNFIRSKCEGDVTGFYDKLVQHLEPEDSIVSFNWDVLIELAFRRAGREFTYLPVGSDNATVLLKPHGSVNWYPLLDRELLIVDSSKNVEVLGGNLGYFLLYLKDPLSEPDLGRSSHFVQRALSSVPAIVPPQSAKQLDVGGRTADAFVDAGHEAGMRAVWGTFSDLVCDASEITVFGYSLPGSDAASIEVLKNFSHNRDSGQKRVRIIDKKVSIVERYRALVHPEAELVANSCEEFFN